MQSLNWYVVPFFQKNKQKNKELSKNKQTNKQGIIKKQTNKQNKELSKTKISPKTWWRHRDVIKCAWMER